MIKKVTYKSNMDLRSCNLGLNLDFIEKLKYHDKINK